MRVLLVIKVMVKEMLSIIDKLTIQCTVEGVISSIIEDILIITGKAKHVIEDHFEVNLELKIIS